jgi:signal transduction histidine kinase
MSGVAAISESARLEVLIIEDSEEDTDLMILELKRAGYNPIYRRASDAAAMQAALKERHWDLILCDYSMPHFSVAGALHLLQSNGLDIPFIIVSATIGEEAAVEAMRAGAHDYILKHRIGRLAPAIRRELRESAIRRERRNLEQQLQHAQKLESLGLLAGGVAHDFNNLLTGILCNASLAMDTIAGAEPATSMLQDIVIASERAADLTRQLLAYAGKGRFVIEPVSLSRLVRDLSELIRTSASRKVEVALELQPDLPVIEADSGQIQQLVMNLIINAVEAVGDRLGKVRVITATREVTSDDMLSAFVPEPPAPGRHVVLQVSDTGCGMSAAVQSQIFDPFFTTKFTGRGLGLAAALGIVRSHGGAISVESVPGVGTTFTVLLPANSGKRAIPSPDDDRRMADRFLAGTGAILIVDDEDVVRRTARATLERYGYSVFEAADGRDGLDLFSRLHDRLSAVLLDLMMPRMSGDEVWAHLRRIRPDMKIVISSGYEEAEAMKLFSPEPTLFFIKKPYTAATLAAKFKSVLADTRQEF